MRAALVLVTLAACGDDGVRRLADAPLAPDAAVDAATDAMIDGAIDAAPTTQSTWTAASGMTPDVIGCVPWTLVDTSDEDPVLGGGELSLVNNADAETLFYSHTTVLTMPAMLVIEAQVRYGGGTGQGIARTSTAIGFALANDMKNTLFIRDGEIFLLTAENTADAPFATTTTDAAHTYRIEVNTTTNAITVLRDGIAVLTGSLFLSPYDVSDYITWGESSVVVNGGSHWTRVSHNALSPIVCP